MVSTVDSLASSAPPAERARNGLIAAGTTPLHRLDGDLWVEVKDVPSAAASLASDWDDLAVNASDPNVFFERWFLGPAVSAFGQGRNIQLAMVYRGSTRKDVAPGLVGLFPVEVMPRRGLLSKTLRLFHHEYAFLLTPLIREGHAVETWQAFLQWADSRSGCDLVELPLIRGEGAVARALADVLYRRSAPSLISVIHPRALLRRSPSAEDSLAAALTAKQRHEYARQSRRLAEQGAVDYRRLETADAAEWIQQFIELESRGWKGEAGTSLADNATARQFFMDSLSEAAARSKLQAIGLWHAGRPIALKLNLLAGAGSFAFKIAYDEAFHKFSPGVLLELENVRVFHEHCDAAWMDSCASPNHPMINRIWRNRALIQHVLVSTGTWRGDLAVGCRPLGRVLKRFLSRRDQPTNAKTPSKPTTSATTS
jgi:hypothetical protein